MNDKNEVTAEEALLMANRLPIYGNNELAKALYHCLKAWAKMVEIPNFIAKPTGDFQKKKIYDSKKSSQT